MKFIKLFTVFEAGNLAIIERAIHYYFSENYAGFIKVIIPQNGTGYPESYRKECRKHSYKKGQSLYVENSRTFNG